MFYRHACSDLLPYMEMTHILIAFHIWMTDLHIGFYVWVWHIQFNLWTYGHNSLLTGFHIWTEHTYYWAPYMDMIHLLFGFHIWTSHGYIPSSIYGHDTSAYCTCFVYWDLYMNMTHLLIVFRIFTLTLCHFSCVQEKSPCEPLLLWYSWLQKWKFSERSEFKTCDVFADVFRNCGSHGSLFFSEW